MPASDPRRSLRPRLGRPSLDASRPTERREPLPIPLRRVATDRWLLSVVFVGAALRALYAVTANVPLDIGDQLQYKMLAEHFGAWWQSADAVRTPGYPAFLAALGWL